MSNTAHEALKKTETLDSRLGALEARLDGLSGFLKEELFTQSEGLKETQGKQDVAMKGQIATVVQQVDKIEGIVNKLMERFEKVMGANAPTIKGEGKVIIPSSQNTQNPLTEEKFPRAIEKEYQRSGDFEPSKRDVHTEYVGHEGRV